ncbi:MAG: hypothetical protein ABIE14_01525 [Patescibacteria group bacterium]
MSFETDDRSSRTSASFPSRFRWNQGDGLEDKPEDNLPETLPDPYAGMTRKEINRIPLGMEAKDLVYDIHACLQEAYSETGEEGKQLLLNIRERIEELTFQSKFPRSFG